MSGKELFSGIASAFGIVAGIFLIAGIFFGVSVLEGNPYISLTHATYLFIIFLLIYYILNRKQKTEFISPKVKFVSDDGTLVCENQDWLAVGVGCSIFSQSGEFEAHVCNADVINIQANGLVQIRTEDKRDDAEVAEMKANMDRILIKPGYVRNV